jgi:hypothetical protein
MAACPDDEPAITFSTWPRTHERKRTAEAVRLVDRMERVSGR